MRAYTVCDVSRPLLLSDAVGPAMGINDWTSRDRETTASVDVGGGASSICIAKVSADSFPFDGL